MPRLRAEAYWTEKTAPLAEFLKEWRTINQIWAWRKEAKISEDNLRNSLAWLYINKKARFHVDSGMWGPAEGADPINYAVKSQPKKQRKPVPKGSVKKRKIDDWEESELEED